MRTTLSGTGTVVTKITRHLGLDTQLPEPWGFLAGAGNFQDPLLLLLEFASTAIQHHLHAQSGVCCHPGPMISHPPQHRSQAHTTPPTHPAAPE